MPPVNALPSTTSTHLRELFSDTIDWTLITTHLPDMLRVALSISQGKIRSSTILRKLGTESRKNKLYVAFRELGRVVRTLFLLHFISDEELRRTINAATNIAEAWNGFVQWVAFGGEGVIRQNNREEQRKIIRYNHLVANLVVFHNVVSMTRVLQELIDEGYPVTPEIIARLSPYKTEHINRFGHYELRFDQVPPPVTEELRLSPRPALHEHTPGSRKNYTDLCRPPHSGDSRESFAIQSIQEPAGAFGAETYGSA